MDSRLASARFFRVAISGLLVLDLAASVAAQAPAGKPRVSTPPARDLRHAFGVNEADGVLWGGADGFKMRFGTDEVEFTPALGHAAEHDLPLAWSTLSVGRGAEAQAIAAVAPRRVGAATVEYDRTPGVVERHEVRADGVELSYVFASAPAGPGDLVVRLQLRSELPLELVDGTLRCVRPDVGGVSWSAVTGLDAAGRSVPGAMHLDGSVLELSLPAAFLATAAFPVTLDPFVQPVVPIAVDPLFQEMANDVAYDSSTDTYVVVWWKVFSDYDFDIRGQFLDGNGALDPFGYWFIETASDTRAWGASVASLPKNSRFMAVWVNETIFPGSTTVVGRSLSSVGFGLSSLLTLDTSHLTDFSIDIAGHSSPAVDVMSVVWTDSVNIKHRNVTVPYAGNPTAAASTQLLAALDSNWVEGPHISKSGGDSHWLMVVATRIKEVSPGVDDNDVQGTLINEFGDVIWGPALISSTPDSDSAGDVDGDGSVFFTSVVRVQTNPQSSWFSVHVVRTVLGPNGFSNVETLIDDPTAQKLSAEGGSVAFTGNGVLVVWTKQYAGEDWDIASVGLDAWSNTIADPLAYLDYNADAAFGPVACAKYSANHALGDGVLCSWTVGPDSFIDTDKDVLAAVVDPELGVVVDWGGATALGGKASVSAATVGNSGFTHFYDGLYGFNSVTLAVGVAPVFAPFCTGTLIPNPIFFLPLATGVDSTIVLPTPLPPDPTLLGLTIWEQYAESDPFTPPCGKNLQLSNGLSITIE